MIETAAEILVGTAFYVAVLWLAQRHPRATGIMLTFPTLNGIALLMTEPAVLAEVASAMLLMPVFNGVLWAGYLAAFERLARAGPITTATRWLLSGAATAAWLVFAVAIARYDWGIPEPQQALYWLASLAGGLALTFAWRRPPDCATATHGTDAVLGRPPPRKGEGDHWALGMLLSANRARIALFTLTLALVAAADRLGGPPALLGALAGLPLVALFGLHSIAGNAAVPLEARRRTLAAMATGVWIGPCVAIGFVSAYWRALTGLAARTTGWAYDVAGAGLLLVAWAACLLAVWAMAHVLQTAFKVPTRTP